MTNYAGITALNNGNGNQASMYVNYVKVYQKGTADESLNTLSPGDSQGGDNNQGGGNQGGDNNQGGGSQGGNESQYVCDPALSNTTSVGKLYDVVLLDGAGVESLRAAGKTVQDLRMDDANRFFYIWENTFAEADQSYPGVEMHTDGYTSLDVTNVGWSGAGFCIVNAAADLRHFTDDTHFHCGLRTTNGRLQKYLSDRRLLLTMELHSHWWATLMQTANGWLSTSLSVSSRNCGRASITRLAALAETSFRSSLAAQQARTSASTLFTSTLLAMAKAQSLAWWPTPTS